MKKICTIAAIVWLEIMRRKDVYVLLILLGALLVGLVSLNVFGLGGIVGYVKDLGLLIVWLFSWILAVSISTRELPQEEASGTIFPLLAKPLTRAELIAGKWLGCWSILGGAMALFYGLVVAVVLLQGGSFDGLALGQAFLLHWVAVGILSAAGLMLSTRLNRDAASALTYVLSIAALVILPRVPMFLAELSGLRATAMMIFYYLAPHFELFDMRMRLVHQYGPAPAGAFLGVLAYGFTFIGLFLWIAWLAYRHKRFSRTVAGIR